MKRAIFLVTATAVTLFASGCVSDSKSASAPTPTPKAQATEQWNDARAAVMGGLADDQFKNGNFDKSRQSVDEAMRLNPKSARFHILSAKLAIEQGQLELADKELATARVLDPKDAEADYLSGVVCQRWQKPDAAAEFYLIAGDKNPHEVAYVLAHAEMLVAMNKRDDAIALLQDKAAFFEHSPALHDALGQLLVQAGKYAEGIESLREAMALANDDSSIRLHLAMACFQDKQYREAADLFGRLLHEPDSDNRADLHLAHAECLMQLDRTADARIEYDAVCRLNPDSTAGWLGAAKVAMVESDLRRCEISIQRARAIDPTSEDGLLMLGYLRIKQSRFEDALAAFQTASSLDRNDPVVLCLIGYVMEKTGRADQAPAYYARALQIKPNNAMAMKLMASADVGE
ncbi:MAG: tetratricopeptide repeat protein [Phycisphaerae bacterium]|nr:tetratricopeptide repeat protein [Phycisphaerae bacterium]